MTSYNIQSSCVAALEVPWTVSVAQLSSRQHRQTMATVASLGAVASTVGNLHCLRRFWLATLPVLLQMAKKEGKETTVLVPAAAAAAADFRAFVFHPPPTAAVDEHVMTRRVMTAEVAAADAVATLACAERAATSVLNLCQCLLRQHLCLATASRLSFHDQQTRKKNEKTRASERERDDG